MKSYRKFLFLGTFLLVSLSSFNVKSAVNVKNIQDEIQMQNAKWIAKSNWVSELPVEQVKRMLGSQERPKSPLNYSDVYSKSLTYETIDWRNVSGINWVGDILNQGNCGSCVAFATIGTLESQVTISSGAPWLRPKFSPQALFACGGGACERGWMSNNAASFVKQSGVVDNACAPYTMGSDGKDVACTQFCQGQSERTYKVVDTYFPSGWSNNSAQKVKEALKKGPLVTSLTVYEDFLSYSSGIYQSVSSKALGGHAVSLVGYNDQERYWIIRNSWGKDWGENGYARISWDDKSGIASTTIGFEVAPNSLDLAVTSPKENDYVSGNLDIKVQTQTDVNSNVQINLLQSGSLVRTLEMQRGNKSNQFGTSINTMELKDGKYELRAVGANSKSLVRGFTVSNHRPNIKVSFSGHDVDLSRPVKDRIEFDIKVKSSSLLPQSLDLMVTKIDGTIVARRTIDVVLNKMLLGFHFKSIPNGEYLVFFKAHLPAAGEMYDVDSEKVKIINKN